MYLPKRRTRPTQLNQVLGGSFTMMSGWHQRNLKYRWESGTTNIVNRHKFTPLGRAFRLESLKYSGSEGTS